MLAVLLRYVMLCGCIMVSACGRYPDATIVIDVEAKVGVNDVRRIVESSGLAYERRIDPRISGWLDFGSPFGPALAAVILCSDARDCDMSASIYIGKDNNKVIVLVRHETMLDYRLRGDSQKVFDEIANKARSHFGPDRVTVVEPWKSK